MYKDQLKKQFDFLRRSCKLYDEGNENESIRIAVALRVLFYDRGKNSVSLLSHLKQKNNTNLLSTCETIEESEQKFPMKISMMIVGLSSGDGRKPWLNNTEKKVFIPINQWLNENIFIAGEQKFSREDIIKLSANKDGGAHVDKPNKAVNLLKDSLGELIVNHNNHKISKKLENSHYILLRQFAYEVLNSKDLFKLNDIKFTKYIEAKSYTEYLDEGFYFNQNKEYFKALESYKEAISIRPNNNESAYNNMGNIYRNLGEFNYAKKSYLQAIEQNKNYIDPLYNIALIYKEEKRYDLVIEAYEKILKIDNNYFETKGNFSVIIKLLEQKDEILYQYNNVFSSSENVLYLHELGLGLLQNDNYENAIIVLKKALKFSNNDLSILCNIGIAHCVNKKCERALEVFDKLIALNTKQIEICLNILEYKLVCEKPLDDKLIKQYKNFFIHDENSLMLITILFILIKARDNENIDTDIEIFEEMYANKKIKNHFNYADKWIASQKNKNIQLLKVSKLLKKYLT